MTVEGHIDLEARKALEYKERCLQIVQRYIDDMETDERKFLADCRYITRTHFEDLIEERACINLCGYALCGEKIVCDRFKVNQVYHIRNNKVYDISRRKNFCSDLCFKRSDFLRNQISTEPMYLRKIPVPELRIYTEKLGLAGDEVRIKEVNVSRVNDLSCEEKLSTKNFSKQEIVMKAKTKQNLLRDEQKLENKISSPYVQEETFKELKYTFHHLCIHEKNVLPTNTIEKSESECEILNTNLITNKIEEHYPQECFLGQNNSESNLNKSESNKTDCILNEIDNMSTSTSSSVSNLFSYSKIAELKKRKFFSDLISKMSQWMTDNTRILLKVPTTVECGSQEQLTTEQLFLMEDDDEKKIERYRWEYIRLCAKLNEEEAEDKRYDEMVLQQKAEQKKNKKVNCDEKQTNKANPKNDEKLDSQKMIIPSNDKPYEEQNLEKASQEISKIKKVRFQDKTEYLESANRVEVKNSKLNDDDDEKEANKNKYEMTNPEMLFVPPNESLRPNSKRKQIFLTEIRAFIEEIFDLQMEIAEIVAILDQIKAIVDTFHLTAQTMSLGRKRNMFVSVLLLRIALIYGLLDRNTYDHLFNGSNLVISKLMAKFHLTNEMLDNSIAQMIDVHK